jgi:peptidyl-dipeptidase A
MWLDTYTMDLEADEDFRADLEALWQNLRPLYEKLHGFVRYKLRQTEWGSEFGERDPIPAHLSGNMWAQTWENIYPLVAPYPEEPNPLEEVNVQLVEQVHTFDRCF